MKIIDISWPISENITSYKDRNAVKIISSKKWKDSKSREHKFILSSHTGTHVDGPLHFLKKGKSIDQFSLNQMCGPCQVLDLTKIKGKITKKDLEKFEIREERVLLKTRNSKLKSTSKFKENFVYLDKKGASYLIKQKVKVLGIDYLGIERNQKNNDTHRLLLKKEILIVEGLRLGKVKEGEYVLYCLPLYLKGLEAAPARVVLVR